MSQLTEVKPTKITHNISNETYQSNSKLSGARKAVHDKGKQTHYNLGGKRTINKPQRYLQETELNKAKKLIFKMKQKSRKISVIKEINQINQVAHEKGSRSKISYLKGSLN